MIPPLVSKSKIYTIQTGVQVVGRCISVTAVPDGLAFEPACVRKGTRVWMVEAPSAVPPHAGVTPPVVPPHAGVTPPIVPPHAGGQEGSLPACGEGWGGG